MRGNMKAERVRLGMSMQQVADSVGVHVNAVSRWESGDAEPMGSNLIKLSHLYGCSPEYLMGKTSDRDGEAVTK